MARPRRPENNGRLRCAEPPDGCGRFLHPTRFYGRKRQTPNGSVWEYDRTCKACQKSRRDDEKNEDRATAIVKGRAETQARKSGVTFEFMWFDMNYRALVVDVRARLEWPDEAICKNCGHEHDSERDVQLDHVLPPRHPKDWARLHARNIAILSGDCNQSKNDKDYASWLDEQEDVRLSIAAHYGADQDSPVRTEDVQLSLV